MSDNVASTSTSTSVPTASLPTVEEINEWNRDRVKGFLQEKSAELELEVNDIDVIYGQRVSGKVFLRLNEEQLTRDSGSFKLPYGPASAIAELVKQIKGEQPSADLKRRLDEVVEVTGRMEGRMDNMSRDIKKVRLNSEVLWFSAPATDSDTVSQKGSNIRLLMSENTSFPFKLTKTPHRRVYGKFKYPPQNVSEKVLQEYFINECRSLNTQNTKLVVEDVHSIPLLATRKPDFVFIAKNRPLDALHVVAVGEIKNRSGKEFTNADVGQVIAFGEKVLQLQPQRAYVYAILTDCISIDIYKVTRVTYNSNNSDNIRFFYGHIKKELLDYNSLGWKYLVTILECKLEDLGWLEPSLEFNLGTVMLVRSINTGRTSNVYEGRFVDSDVVVKLAKSDNYLSCFEREKAVLEILDSPHIPKLHMHNEKSLIMTPLGMKVKSLEKKDVKDIIETLKIVHGKDIVHMDLRRYNFVRDNDENIIIIDWGYSATKNETGNFAGALECMPDDILELLIKGVQITYEPRIDLICLVRSLYLMLHKPASTVMERMSFDKTPSFNSRARNVLDFWSSHGISDFWQNIYKEANNLNYDNLIKELEVLF